ncbi:Ger(x)C family spore germination protein [Piscibacillus sp. B03]|uniref:Ger(x)C family spore germination protein n=1 Tax=Piscibacillus sp. B03 TaxID=3457430 RepID=UPI003FCE8BE4
MKKVHQLIIVCCISLVLLTGCLETHILEELGIATVYGFDKSEEGDYLESTTVLFQFNPDVTDASQIIHSEGETFRELRNNANKKSGYKIVSGQLRSIIFGPRLSKEGIFPYIDTLERDASLSDMVYIAISNQQTEHLLTASNYEQAPNIGTYIQDLIETAVRDERITSNTLHEFIRKYFTVGYDPLVPIVENHDNKAQLTGLAIFQDDKYVGDIPIDDIFYARLVSDKFRQGQVDIKFPIEPFKNLMEDYEEPNSDQVIVVLDQLHNRTDVEITNPAALNFKVDVDIKGRIVELTERIDLQNKEALKKLEEHISEEIKTNIERLIQKSKETNSDFFGFGKTYISENRNQQLTKDEWRDMYPNINVTVNVKTSIRNYGIIE